MQVSSTRTRKTATIYDIARAADVSHQSVSRYMRGLDMRQSTKSKIEKALETLDYRPNLSARALTTGRSHRIGALTHETNQVGPSLIIQGATAAARRAGYLLDVVTLDMADVAELTEALELLMKHDLAGILAFASTDSTRSVFEQTDFGVPVVIAGETEDPRPDPGAEVDDESGIEGLVAHLAELGHESFLHIAGPRDWAAARNRLHAVESALSRRGLGPLVVHGDWSARSGYETVRELFSTDAREAWTSTVAGGASADSAGTITATGRPTAVVAANDQMALGAIHALVELGLEVPRDISVTGVDDTPESAYYVPALTTVRLDFRAQGERAFTALLDHVEGSDETAPDPHDSPRSTIVLRSSTGPVHR